MPSYNQLPQLEGDTPSALPSRFRIYYLTAIVCCGGVLFGYDSGVIGGVLTFDSFLRDFQYAPALQTRVSAIAVGIQQAGALVGALAIGPLTTRRGRRLAMMGCSAVFCAGVVLEVLNSHSLPVFYLGRVICGLGIGGSATVIPIYLSEMSPTDIRARLGSCYQFTFTIGILVSYWIDYGVQFAPSTPAQWQIPLALQLVPGALMGLGMLTLEESVRWLLVRGDSRRAWKSLVWIRADDGSAVAEEFRSMEHAVEADRVAKSDFSLAELLQWRNARRFLLVAGLFLAQQSTGATAMAYFGPQFFALIVGEDNASLTLLLTGVFGGIKVLACGVFIIWVADRFGRRPLLILGALGMAVCMLVTAFVVRAGPVPHPKTPTATATTTSTTAVSATGIATIALIYLDIIIYNLSWGPLPWPCSAELFSTRIREPGVAVGVSAQWLSNFVWSFSTPYMLAGIGWATFLVFGVLDVLFSAFIAAWLPETAGMSLEEIEKVFEGQEGDDVSKWSRGRASDEYPFALGSEVGEEEEGSDEDGEGEVEHGADDAMAPLNAKRQSVDG